ncbi:hypothetical protein B1A_03476 [mine drainage metagenome]|uniref:Uncharacterized protein n=2 Tax=mine drainage metagenome TaxID=410659 RepID=T1BR11_9ZZZZ
MRVSVVIFRLPPRRPNRELGQFVKQFYGQETSSWGGKYSYHRSGLLDRIPHRKFLRGVVIVRDQDVREVRVFLEEWKAQVEVRDIRPTREDLAVLRRAVPAQPTRQ